MASQNFLGASITGGTREKTYFEQQREALIGEIANSFEHVLANINKLNRSLEAVITVCICPSFLSFHSPAVSFSVLYASSSSELSPVGITD